MTLADDLERLSQVQLFDGFTSEQLRMLAFGSKRQIHRGGEEIYREGAKSDGGHVVIIGQVDLVVAGGERQIVLASYLENSLVGEMALITENRRVATAMAHTNCELLHIPRELFKRLLAEYPELAIQLHKRIALSVRQLMRDIINVQDKMQHIPDLTSMMPADEIDPAGETSVDIEGSDDGYVV